MLGGRTRKSGASKSGGGARCHAIRFIAFRDGQGCMWAFSQQSTVKGRGEVQAGAGAAGLAAPARVPAGAAERRRLQGVQPGLEICQLRSPAGTSLRSGSRPSRSWSSWLAAPRRARGWPQSAQSASPRSSCRESRAACAAHTAGAAGRSEAEERRARRRRAKASQLLAAHQTQGAGQAGGKGGFLGGVRYAAHAVHGLPQSLGFVHLQAPRALC